MMPMRSVNELCNRRTAFGEVKAMLHKLLTGDVRVADLDLSAFIHRTDRPRDI